MLLVVGLGNHGEKYNNTRHNAGFLAVDFLAKKLECEEWKLMKKTNSRISTCRIEGKKLILAKPNVYMNESGGPIAALMKYYNIDASQLIVIHDDADLPIGDKKVQTSRGSAGHNGVESIMNHLGTKDFTRIRLGVRPEDNTLPAMELVLKPFSDDDKTELESSFQYILQAVQLLLE